MPGPARTVGQELPERTTVMPGEASADAGGINPTGVGPEWIQTVWKVPPTAAVVSMFSPLPLIVLPSTMVPAESPFA